LVDIQHQCFAGAIVRERGKEGLEVEVLGSQLFDGLNDFLLLDLNRK
jgi:hypothetical protein